MLNPLTFQNHPFILFVGFDEHVLNVNTSKFGLSKSLFAVITLKTYRKEKLISSTQKNE